MSKAFRLYFEPKEKQRELEIQKTSDIVAWSKDLRTLIDEQDAQGFRCSGVVHYDGGMFQLAGFCNQCGLAIFFDWAETSGLPSGLVEDNVAWCRKCYFARKGGI